MEYSSSHYCDVNRVNLTPIAPVVTELQSQARKMCPIQTISVYLFSHFQTMRWYYSEVFPSLGEFHFKFLLRIIVAKKELFKIQAWQDMVVFVIKTQSVTLIHCLFQSNSLRMLLICLTSPFFIVFFFFFRNKGNIIWPFQYTRAQLFEGRLAPTLG